MRILCAAVYRGFSAVAMRAHVTAPSKLPLV